jgi:deoxyribodipyrimidine photolyase-related protein
MRSLRNLVVVLGDQLSLQSSAFNAFDPAKDMVWMAEVAEESTHVLSHKTRIAYFLSAMRHFADDVRARKYKLFYRSLEETGIDGTLAGELEGAIANFHPHKVIMVEPGEYRVEQNLRALLERHKVAYEFTPDTHFYCSRQEFEEWRKKHAHLRMEFFYREMRKRAGVLMEKDKPVDQRWNFDSENRKSFGSKGPGLLLPPMPRFKPGAITLEVIDLVSRRFAKHPGSLSDFDFPVTRSEARRALKDFISNRLPYFGDFQDAMWTNEPYLFHSRLSGPLNLKLLDPREVVMAAEQAYHDGHAPLSAVEGFIRQILGWREYVRGVYWSFMPEYVRRNALGVKQPLPDLYWDANTDMNCLKQVVGQTLQLGYAHHIQRLMITGLFAMLFGVDPVEVHKWYLAIYWDAVEWVELPNTTGMSQFSDGSVMGSKPYAASGKYIQRMSNYCQDCRYRPDQATGSDACPFTTLYWDFLMQHEKLLSGNQRMRMQLRNLVRISSEKKDAIKKQAHDFRDSLPKGNY